MCAVLQVNNLRYAYSPEVKFEFPEIALDSGQQLAILGPSGCGKSTLLNIISGIVSAQEGTIRIQGKEITKMKRAELDKFRAQELGFIFQSPEFIESLTVKENLKLSASYAHKVPQDINTLLTDLQLEHREHMYPRQLSQGERQRLAIARAVIHRPSLILADEPTSALDDLRTEQVLKILKGISDDYETSILIVTHDNRLKQHLTQHINLV